MHFLTKFSIALVLPAFVPTEPFEPLDTVTYTAAANSAVVPAGETFTCTPTVCRGAEDPHCRRRCA